MRAAVIVRPSGLTFAKLAALYTFQRGASAPEDAKLLVEEAGKEGIEGEVETLCAYQLRNTACRVYPA
eukprot:gene8459-829_t